ncbi:FAD binding domain protein [Fusarium sp. NRRL 52700]|nr:FAD binding domain protein [Fusarium sp. NRRL 52700]
MIPFSRTSHGVGLVAFHRAHIVEVLNEGLPEEAKARYFLNKKEISIEWDDEGVSVACDDGNSYEGSIALGTDGVNSVTRNIMRDLTLSENPNREWDPQQPFKSVYRCLWASFPRPSAPGEDFETTSQDLAAMYLTGRERGWILLDDKADTPTTDL